MNTINFECNQDVFLLIPESIREFITIKTIEDKSYDYSDSKEWNELKSESSKYYKKLKKLEYEIRKQNGDLNK